MHDAVIKLYVYRTNTIQESNTFTTRPLQLTMQSNLEILIRKIVKNPLQAEINAIEDIFTKREYKKGEVFKRSNTVAKELGFLVEGSARTYVVTSKGNEITTLITEENNFIADLISVRTNEPTPLALDFLENSKVLVAPISEHKRLIEINLAYNILIREHMADQAVKLNKRQIAFLTGTARERYQFIVDNSPQLIDRFPLKFIANIIGITPTQLSRVRNKK
jgi:CRP-like cAMP-binding protein